MGSPCPAAHPFGLHCQDPSPSNFQVGLVSGQSRGRWGEQSRLGEGGWAPPPRCFRAGVLWAGCISSLEVAYPLRAPWVSAPRASPSGLRLGLLHPPPSETLPLRKNCPPSIFLPLPQIPAAPPLIRKSMGAPEPPSQSVICVRFSVCFSLRHPRLPVSPEGRKGHMGVWERGPWTVQENSEFRVRC